VSVGGVLVGIIATGAESISADLELGFICSMPVRARQDLVRSVSRSLANTFRLDRKVSDLTVWYGYCFQMREFKQYATAGFDSSSLVIPANRYSQPVSKGYYEYTLGNSFG